ncbi:MAG: hypothetical protein JW932_15540 [Deltaproteobacteria bacterium]|nr:hypothetical protein [Deltaproteobacteria bacterium]
MNIDGVREIGTIAGILILAKLGWELVTKIIWDWLKGRNGRGQITVADNLPVTHGELREHCNGQQKACLKALKPELQLMTQTLAGEIGKWQAKVDLKLYNDHERFDKIEATLKEIRDGVNGGKPHKQ